LKIHAGIKLNNVINGYVSNNTCNNNYLGMSLFNSTNSIIEKNNIKNSRWGIYLGYCDILKDSAI